MAKKHVDPLKAKQKKQKILAAVLGVAFLGLLAFQVPRMLKMMHPTPPPSVSGRTSTTASPPAGTPSLAAPTLRGAEVGPSTTVPSSSLASDGTAVAQDGQLASFSRFASKDPFAPQLSDEPKPAAGASGGSPTSGGGSATPAPSKEPASGSAVISVNGTLYTVPVGTDFPQSNPSDPTVVPLFHLVSVTAHTAKISIVGGSYSNGATTVTLKEKKTVTLMNTADGTRYKLTLMPPGTQVESQAPASTTTSSTVTIPPPSP